MVYRDDNSHLKTPEYLAGEKVSKRASAIYRPKGLPLHRERGLREISVGAWERLTWGEILLHWPQQLKYFNARPDLWTVEGAETAAEVLERGLKTVKAIAANHDGEAIALVAHGYIIRVMLSHLQGYKLEEMGQTPTGDNTCVASWSMRTGNCGWCTGMTTAT